MLQLGLMWQCAQPYPVHLFFDVFDHFGVGKHATASLNSKEYDEVLPGRLWHVAAITTEPPLTQSLDKALVLDDRLVVCAVLLTLAFFNE